MRLLTRLDQTLVDIKPEQLSLEFQRTLSSFRQELESLELQKISTQGLSLAKELQTGVNEISSFVTELRQEEGSFQKLMGIYGGLGAQLSQVLEDSKIDQASAATLRAMEAIAVAGGEVGGLSHDIREELSLILDALESIRRFADQLERDPGSLIYGKTPSSLPGAVKP